MNRLWKLGLPLLVFFLYWTLGLPWYVDLLVAVVAFALLPRINTANNALLLVSVASSLALAEIAVRVLMPSSAAYYREHEKWRHDATRYERNVSDTIAMPYGDLVAMDPGLAALLAVARTVEFRTDAEGMRNGADYHGQKLVLVGDSFIVGNGTTQEQTLPELLRREHGLDAYSIAFPSDTREYFETSRQFLGRHPGARFLFFYFEGNDFEYPSGSRTRARKPAGYDRFRNRMRKRLYPSLQYPIVLFGVSRRLEQRWLVGQGARPSPVTVHEIGGRAVGFFGEYIVAARSGDLRFPAEYAAPEVVARTSCVFFIPTKYRVYKKWIRDGAALPEPPPALVALQSFYASRGVVVLDLTPALRKRAAQLLATDEMVFWPDDTHWNQHGMRTAAAEVAECAQAR